MFRKSWSPVCLYFTLVLLVVSCSRPPDVPIAVSSPAESIALDAFKQFADVNRVVYDRVSVKTLTIDPFYATVRVTASFRPCAKCEWTEQFADVEVRNVGGKWYANAGTMYFQDTESTQQTKTAVANATQTSISATQVAAQATYESNKRGTDVAIETNRKATATALEAAKQQAATAVWVSTQQAQAAATANARAIEQQTKIAATATADAWLPARQESLAVLDQFVKAATNNDCNMLRSLLTTDYQRFRTDIAEFCQYWLKMRGYQVNSLRFDIPLSLGIIAQVNFCCGEVSSSVTFQFKKDNAKWKIDFIAKN